MPCYLLDNSSDVDAQSDVCATSIRMVLRFHSLSVVGCKHQLVSARAKHPDNKSDSTKRRRKQPDIVKYNRAASGSLTFPEFLSVHILHKILWPHPYRATNRLPHLSSSLLLLNFTRSLFSSQSRSTDELLSIVVYSPCVHTIYLMREPSLHTKRYHMHVRD